MDPKLEDQLVAQVVELLKRALQSVEAENQFKSTSIQTANQQSQMVQQLAQSAPAPGPVIPVTPAAPDLLSSMPPAPTIPPVVEGVMPPIAATPRVSPPPPPSQAFMPPPQPVAEHDIPRVSPSQQLPPPPKPQDVLVDPTGSQFETMFNDQVKSPTESPVDTARKAGMDASQVLVSTLSTITQLLYSFSDELNHLRQRVNAVETSHERSRSS